MEIETETTRAFEPETPTARLDAIIEAATAVTAAAAHRPDLPDIDRVAAAFAEAAPATVEPACPDRVHELIAEAANFTEPGLSADLAASVLDGARDLSWWTSYGNYSEPDIVELLESYFVSSIIAAPGTRQAPLHHDDVAVYLTVQGPSLLYPKHVHKAPELYYPVAGTGLWQTGDRAFAPKPPGSWIVHPTGTRHAMESLAEPMLSLAIWTADVDSVPVIVRD